jgi:hypothetical protein
MSSSQNVMEMDVWVRGSNDAVTQPLQGVPSPAADWSDADVRSLLVAMLLALERAKNPGGVPPSVSLRGFSWIVSPGAQGVIVHVEMQIGTASAGPFAIEAQKLTDMISRVMTASNTASEVVH